MTVRCLYDNPETYRRELWIDGELFQFVSADVLLHHKEELNKLLSNNSNIEYSLFIHPWQSGVFHYGNKDAMRKLDSREICSECGKPLGYGDWCLTCSLYNGVVCG